MSGPQKLEPAWSYQGDMAWRTLPSARFLVTEVMMPDHHIVIKLATGKAEEDLGNSAAWAQDIHARGPQTFDVARAQASLKFDDGKIRTNRAEFAWIEGGHAKENELAELSRPVASIIRELGSMAIDWQGDPRAWGRSKLDGLGREALDVLPQELRKQIEAVTTDEHLSIIKPGVVHGDLVPKNFIIQLNKRLALLDAEYGTHGLRPHFAVPRMRDAAYYYHTLRCQYQQPATADGFLQAMEEQFVDDQTWRQEFWLSVIERTLSMYTLFVIRQPGGVDERRKQPDEYLATLQTAVDMLQAS